MSKEITVIHPAKWFRPTTASTGTAHAGRGVLAGRRRALLIGIVAAGAAATAAGAAPASITPWGDHSNGVVVLADPTTTVESPTATTIHHETTTALKSEPTTTAPATTQPVNTQPVNTQPTPTQPASDVSSEPSPVEPPAAAPPASPLIAPPQPAPTTTEVRTLATLQLSCAVVGELLNHVSCEWSGQVPDGFVRYLVLRGNQTAKGRVPFSSTDPTAHTFTDEPLAPGSYSYVVVVIGSSGKSIAHSNLVPIVIAAG